MFNSTVLEVGIGLVFCFCAVSLMVSSINEGIASVLKLRSKYLLQGVKDILNDPNLDGLALDLYNHALFNPKGSGTADSEQELDSKPSYVDPRQFALSLVNILQTNAADPMDLAGAIQNLPDAQLRQMLSGMYTRAAGDINQFEAELAYWFDSGMQRLSGDYKRTMQWWTLLFGLALAVLMNIDTLHVFQVLWVHPALAQGLGAAQLANPGAALNQLSVTSLPIGWDRPPFIYDHGRLALAYGADQLLLMAAGWLLTALSTLFGASFWFDLLQKFTSVRGTGTKAS